MFITKKHLQRRTFLRAAGVAVALPLLDAMVPAMTPTARAAGLSPRRFVGVWIPHGAAPGYYSPVQEGRDFEFSYITQPLAPLRERTLIISGLDTPEAMSTEEEPGGNHARGAVFLSGARPRRDTVRPYLGVTIDQLIAERHGEDTILPSVQVGVEDAGNFGDCNWGYSCAYTNSVSWASPTQPLPTEINPRMVFERLFGEGGSAEERLRERMLSASILDSVMHRVPGLKKGLGPGDRVRLDQYLENIRAIERRIQIAIESPAAEPEREVAFGIPQSKDEHFKVMFDLIALAFEGDVTRSATMMMGRDLSGINYPVSGTNGGWHGTSHHGDQPDNIAYYARMNRYHVSLLAYFLERLKSIPEGDGTVLDHSLTYYASNMGNSHRHAHENVPAILVGGIDGTFQGNRHLHFAPNTERTANLLASILELYGIEGGQRIIPYSTGLLPIA